jgi:hypothetical protein
LFASAKCQTIHFQQEHHMMSSSQHPLFLFYYYYFLNLLTPTADFLLKNDYGAILGAKRCCPGEACAL